MSANLPGGPSPFPGAIGARRPSPLHFRWHSSNVPGLGRHPQLPSSEAAAAPLTAAPGVRSEPRPALDPVPRPPPSGGRVKPGGEGGGGGSPTRDGVGGGGGLAGGELAANTFPMVSARGKVRGQGSGATRTPPDATSGTSHPTRTRFSLAAAAAPVPGLGSAPTPCAMRNRTRCRRRRCFPAPWSLLVRCPSRSAHRPRRRTFYWRFGRKFHPSR